MLDLIVVTAAVCFVLEIIKWPWQSRLQKNIVRVILIVSGYLFWRGIWG